MSDAQLLLVGNFDCDSDYAACAARERGVERIPKLPGRVLDALASAATLMRVLATSDEDTLWTPAPVDATRMLDVPGLPRPRCSHGDIAPTQAEAGIVAWSETESVAKLRSVTPEHVGSRTARQTLRAALGPIAASIVSGHFPEPDAARAANHRGLCVEIAEELGLRLGRCVVHDTAAIDSVSREIPPELGHAIVLKAPHCASGRERIILRDRAELSTDATRARLERLFAGHAELILEPWVERLADFGALAIVGETSTTTLIGSHALDVDGGGRFRAIRVALATSSRAPGIRDDEHDTLMRTIDAVAGRVRDLGYRGPIGIDAWRYRDARGVERFQALGEINARMSFGFIARLLGERVLPALDVDTSRATVLTLRCGGGLDEKIDSDATIVPLVRGDERVPWEARLEIGGEKGVRNLFSPEQRDDDDGYD